MGEAQTKTAPAKTGACTKPSEVDVAVVGAGFSGLYLIVKLRELGLSFRVFEAGSGVGGTWYWNRYPGARCDVESMQYSYSWDPKLEQEWHWSETFAPQPEILKYANHVADRYDLRPHIEFDTAVEAASYDEAKRRWNVTLSTGETLSARFCVMATGCLSAPRAPDIKGVDSFQGPTYHTGQWPHEGVDFTGKRVGVIGTGSSAIQAIPVIAEQAKHLTVFQRTPNYSIPARTTPMSADYEREWKDNYAERREIMRHTAVGNFYERSAVSAADVSDDERQRILEERWARGGTRFMTAFNDLATNANSNEHAAEFVRTKIREIVKDPETAELLVAKDYPIGTKRICADSFYFETYNRDNVRLVDINAHPIHEITAKGVRAGDEELEFDALVFATGFDAMTGTLLKIDIKGRGGQPLAEKWEAGPRTYLGLMTAGFPNMFMITGPGSPSVLSNMMISIEQHVDWVSDALGYLQDRGAEAMEADTAAEDAWVEHVNAAAYKTLYPKAASWYMGANIPGKPRVFLPYIGGVGAYRVKCDEVAAHGYEGFRLERGESAAANRAAE
ncbi:MAG: NAD(P)/FAD-dependent oxidoreductase [Alphaproteobacteria bacterium]|nr:NAD(P)/FAD-dependent oxidoreductase [Alphaproteobacteria bacterium]MCB9931664.1 NAD(P)/FAD-dependent oxidoreductase [Alphaproteobacteria bacterium]